jgi:putative membrane protein
VSPEPWDPGLQSERTRLAWVRAAATLAVGGIGAAGLTLRTGASPVAGVAFTAAALCGGVLLTRTGTRFTRVQRALHAGAPLHDQVDGVLAWIGTLAIAAGALIFVLTR